jgi:hypothetical protein
MIKLNQISENDMKEIRTSQTPLQTPHKKKSKKLFIDPAVEKFLLMILQPVPVNHTSPQCDFIKNQVLAEVWKKVENAKTKGSY